MGDIGTEAYKSGPLPQNMLFPNLHIMPTGTSWRQHWRDQQLAGTGWG